jgi:potassium-transporting ATPase KdpC subunit
MSARILRVTGISVGMMVLMSILLGILYPLVMTGANRAFFPSSSDGSLVSLDGKVVGSKLVGQGFTSTSYFHSRPSATVPPYQPLPTTFENLGPDTEALKKLVDGYISAALKLEGPYNPGLRAKDLPVDMITTSASGIDPEISKANARLQANRVAKVRGVPLSSVLSLVSKETDGRDVGFLGEPGVNVLLLNLDLDKAFGPPKR